MLRSMYSGISGLKNFQTKLDVIGNNISNVNTYGFKKGRVVFKDLISQTTAGASAPTETRGGVNPKQVGLGSQIAAIDTIHGTGSLQTTARTLDLAVSGDGFFQVADATAGLNGYTNIQYTRAGNFYMDKDGYLVNGDGKYLVGSAANVITTQTPILTFKLEDPSATDVGDDKYAGYSYLLNANGDHINSSGGALPSSGVSNHGLRLNGNKLYFGAEPATPLSVTISGSTYEYEVDGEGTLFINNGTDRFEVIANGQYRDASGVTRTFTDTANPSLYSAVRTAVVQTGTRTVDTYTNTGATLKPIKIPTTAQSISIGQDGTVNFVDKDGVLQWAGQLQLAKFPNTSGLEKAGSNYYQQTPNSGVPVLGTATEQGIGSIQSGFLEMSNVDLSEEFTEMIVAQRGFQANSRIITTSDEILQELVNLKR